MERPDLYWFIASAYYVLSMVAPSGQELDDVLSQCIATPWDIADVYDQFAAAITAAGISLVPTNAGTGDFIDGKHVVTCSPTDKLLLAVVLLFSAETCWLDSIPHGAPDQIKGLVIVLVQWGAQRFPTPFFSFSET